MKVLVFGAGGWLGSRFVEYFHGVGLTRQDCDVTNIGAVCGAIGSIRPDVVINCAGVTHSATIPNIDACQATPVDVRRTADVHISGALNVSEECRKHEVPLVHLGSGCVFDGEGPFYEFDRPNPVSWYGETKAIGDRLVAFTNPTALVLRIRMPISAQPHPRNLITKLAGFTRVIDVVNSVTVVEDLLPFTQGLIKEGVRGIVHAVNPDPVRYSDLLEWCRRAGLVHSYTLIDKSELRTQDGRSNCTLGSMHQRMPAAEASIQRVLQAYATQKAAA